jgi:hypothetical protein
MTPLNLKWRMIDDVFRPLPALLDGEQILVVDGNELLTFNTVIHSWAATRTNAAHRNISVALWHGRRLIAAAEAGWMDYTRNEEVIVLRSNTQQSQCCTGDRYCSVNDQKKMMCVQ